MNDKLNTITFTNDFPNTNNTFQELVSSGQQSLIKDKELSLEVIDFYLFCEDNFIDVKNNNDNIYYKEIYPVLNKLSEIHFENDGLFDKNGSTKNAVIKNYLNKELDKPENILALLNAIKTQTLIQITHLEIAKETLKGGKELISFIDNYLGLTLEDVNNFD